MRVQDARPASREERRDLRIRDGVDVGSQPDVVERNSAVVELSGELPGARLVLVEHEEVHVPAPLAQAWKQLEQVRLGAGDPGHLLDVQDLPGRSGHLRDPRCCEHPARPRFDRVPRLDALPEPLSELGPVSRAQLGQLAYPRSELVRALAPEALLRLEQRRRRPDWTRAPASSSQQPRRRPCPAHRRACCSRARRDSRTAPVSESEARRPRASHGRPSRELRHQPLQLVAMRPLVVRESRPVRRRARRHPRPSPRPERRPRAPSRGSSARARASKPVAVCCIDRVRSEARELGEVDAVADRLDLLRAAMGTTGGRPRSPRSRRARPRATACSPASA